MNAELTPKRPSLWDNWYRRALPAYWLFLFCITHFPLLVLPPVAHGDWMAHCAAYGLLAFLFWRFAETFSPPRSKRFAVLLAVWIGAYGAFDEWSQPYFNRSADVYDWLFDVLGSLTVLSLLEWRRRATSGSQGSAA